MRIAVASGKGGTGKTTVSVSLFHFMTHNFGLNVTLLDCDVEEPNAALFFSAKQVSDSREVYQQIPFIDTQTCTFCRKCVEWCAFNAITMVASKKFALIDENLCHSCGACLAACPVNAVKEKPMLLGNITTWETRTGNILSEGRLTIGSSMQTLLVKTLKEKSLKNSQSAILDAPPGTGCPVVQTLSGTDYVVLVTEPTPFGLSDLKTAVEVVKQLNIPFGVVVNKSGLGSDDVYDFLNENNIDLLGNIPFSKAYARNYSKGNLLSGIPMEAEKVYHEIIRKITASI